MKDPVAQRLAFSVLEELPLGLYIARAPDGLAVYANHAFRTILGHGPAPSLRIQDAPAACGIYDRDGRPYRPERLPFVRALAENGPVVVDDMVVRRPDLPAPIHLRAFAAPVPAPEGGPPYVVVAFTDASEEVRAREERRTLEERLAFAVQHAPIALWMTDAAGTIKVSEGALLASLGYAPGQLVGQSVFDLYRDRPEVLDQTRRVLAGEALAAVTEIGEVVMSAHMAPLRAADGRVIGLIGVATDISETRRLERQVRQDDRMRAMGTLAASVAHEINNPLTFVLANLKLAHRELDTLGARLAAPDLDPEALRRQAQDCVARLRELLEPALGGAERVGRITRDLRTFARGEDEPDATADVGEAVRSVVNLVDGQLRARGRLVCEIEPGLAVHLGEARLVQVLLNLLTNAWQALPAGAPDRHEVRVRARGEGARVVLEVSDSGPGVPPADRQRIFEPFVTTKPIGEGTGLGLFVCRNVVRAAGGDITVLDRPAGGALFRVTLPAAATRTAPPASGPVDPSRTGRVLLVDDDPLVARALAATLQAEGFAVQVTHDAAEALAVLTDDDGIDLAYCDVMMNGMTGIDLYRELARRAPGRVRKVVLMTGGAFTEDARAFLERRAEVAVEKPFDIVSDARRRLRA